MPDFSFRHTAPTQGQNSGYWTGEEGPQYLHHDPSTHGNVQHGFIESFDSFPSTQESQTGPRNSRSSTSGTSQAQWHDGLASTQIESNEMSRQESTGAHSQRVAQSSTGNTFDEAVPSRMFSNAQAPFHMSSAGADATIRSISPQQIELQDIDYPFLGDDSANVQHIFHRNSNADMEPHPISVSTGPSFAPFTTTAEEAFSFTAGSNPLGSQGPVSQEPMYNPGTIDSSSMLWDDAATNFLDSPGSSPIEPENAWPVAPFQQVLTSTTNSPMTYSPSLEGLSPRYVQDFPDLVELPPYTTGDRVTRKPMGPRQSKVASDLAANSRQQRLLGSDASDDSFRLVGRSALEFDNTARDHPLYHNVTAGPDGLYHCPWEGQPSCQHKAEKLKCNYE